MNGEVVQSSNTSDMIFSVPELIAFLSQGTTLLPGTIILTGAHQLVPGRFLRNFICAAWVLMGAGLGVRDSGGRGVYAGSAAAPGAGGHRDGGGGGHWRADQPGG